MPIYRATYTVPPDVKVAKHMRIVAADDEAAHAEAKRKTEGWAILVGIEKTGEHTGPIAPGHRERDDPLVSEMTRSQYISTVSTAIVWGWLKIIAFSAIVALFIGFVFAAIRSG